jgi:hypothetical protein
MLDQLGFMLFELLLELTGPIPDKILPRGKRRRERARRAARSRTRARRSRAAASAAPGFFGRALQWLRLGPRRATGGARPGPREEPASPVPISDLPLALGRRVDVAGTAEGEAIVAPVTDEPCVAWWCTIRSPDRFDQPGRAARGVIRLRDESGTVVIDAAAAEPHALWLVSTSIYAEDRLGPPRYDELMAAARAAGWDAPEREQKLTFVEARVTAGQRLVARGFPATSPVAREGAGYRDQVDVELRLEPGATGRVLLSGSTGFPVDEEDAAPRRTTGGKRKKGGRR